MSGSRGFGTTDGVGTTDSIVLSNTRQYDKVTYSFYMSRNSLGGGAIGRVLQKATTGDFLPTFFSIQVGAEYVLRYRHPWSTNGEWYIVLGTAAAQAGAFYCWTYDGGSTTNDPLVWKDGVAQTVVENIAPVGTLGTANTEPWVIGNRKSDNARNHDGKIGVLGIWDRVLPPEAARKLSLGYSPLWYPEGLMVNVDTSLTYDSRNAGLTIVGTKPSDSPPVIYPPTAMSRWIKRAS